MKPAPRPTNKVAKPRVRKAKCVQFAGGEPKPVIEYCPPKNNEFWDGFLAGCIVGMLMAGGVFSVVRFLSA